MLVAAHGVDLLVPDLGGKLVDRVVARGLSQDGIPYPSKTRPDPVAVVEAINTARAEREAARAELQRSAQDNRAAGLDRRRRPGTEFPDTGRITRVYRALGLQLNYDNEKRGGRSDRLSPCV